MNKMNKTELNSRIDELTIELTVKKDELDKVSKDFKAGEFSSESVKLEGELNLLIAEKNSLTNDLLEIDMKSSPELYEKCIVEISPFRCTMPEYADREIDLGEDFINLQKSILKNGLLEMIIIDKNFVIISGRHRHLALEGLYNSNVWKTRKLHKYVQYKNIDIAGMEPNEVKILMALCNQRAKSESSVTRERSLLVKDLCESGMKPQEIGKRLNLAPDYISRILKIPFNNEKVMTLINSKNPPSINALSLIGRTFKSDEIPEHILNMSKDLGKLKKEIVKYKDEELRKDLLAKIQDNNFTVSAEYSNDRMTEKRVEIKGLLETDPDNESYKFVKDCFDYIVQLDEKTKGKRESKLLIGKRKLELQVKRIEGSLSKEEELELKDLKSGEKVEVEK